MKDVARAAGVSVMTVSRAMKDGGSVSAEARARVGAAARDLGYVFDATAANLRLQRTGFIAVTVPTLNNANFADMVGALSRALGAEGLQVLLGATGYDVAQEERLVGQLLRRRPEAVVLTGGSHTAHCRDMLAKAAIPVIETWDLPDEPLGHVVGFSNAATMEMMVQHLTSRGLHRIAFVGGDTNQDTRGADRKRGFLAAMARRGLAADRLIGMGAPPISMRQGADAMARLLVEMPDTQAVICVSDLSAFGALSACARAGVRVPDDMAVAGFGAYEIASVCVPTLTTIDPFPSAIGAAAARLILARDTMDQPFQRIEVTPRLVIGGSTPAR